MEEEKRPRHWRFLIMVSLFWFAQYVFNPYFTPHLTALGFASSTVGLISGVYGFSQLILRIPLGIGADKLRNHRLFIGFGFLCLMLAGVVLRSSTAPAAFVTARFLAGVSASTWVSFTVFFSGLDRGGDNGRAVGTIMAANNFGTMLSYILGMLIFDRVGIGNLYLASVGASVIGFLILLTIRDSAPVPSRNITFSSALGVLRDKNLLLHSMMAALMQLILFATAISFTSNYARTLGANGMQLGFMSIIFNAVGMLGSWLVSTDLRRKLSDRAWIMLGFGCLTAYCFAVPSCTAMTGIYLAQILGGTGRALLMALTMASSSRDVPAELRSTAMGVYQSVYGIGMTLGPILTGFFLDLSSSYRISFAVVGVAGAAGVLWSSLALRRAD